jgi:hypothetical protein
MENVYKSNPNLYAASLEKACKMANRLHAMLDNGNPTILYHKDEAFNLYCMLEYLHLNFDLIPKNECKVTNEKDILEP